MGAEAGTEQEQAKATESVIEEKLVLIGRDKMGRVCFEMASHISPASVVVLLIQIQNSLVSQFQFNKESLIVGARSVGGNPNGV